MEPKAESKYERIRKIGIGSYGVVFKCVNRPTGQIVAIKRYSENDTDPIIRKIAMREVRMLRQLRHPNLIHLIEVFRRKKRLHLVFEYCELTVLDVIEKYANNCPLNLIRKIIWQLVNGVSYCHSHNCIHRDIKPENILINQSGVVKLCDFGFARNMNPDASRAMLKSQSTNGMRQLQLEREAQLIGVPSNQMMQWSNGDMGNNNNENKIQDQMINEDQRKPIERRLALTEYVATRWYRAPELLVGEVYYDTKIDIWAIGCVTAELMIGEPLWPGKTDLGQLNMIMKSLGSLTSSQSHTLATQNLYDQINTERLLKNQQSGSDPIERRLPAARVGKFGVDFVLVCLQMDPLHRPNCERLLQHGYIHSARMMQFVRGGQQGVASGHHQNLARQQSMAGDGNQGRDQGSSNRSAATISSSSNSNHSSPSSLPNANEIGRKNHHRDQQKRTIGIPTSSNRDKGKILSNSQQTLMAASQQQSSQPATKMLVLAPDSRPAKPVAIRDQFSTEPRRESVENLQPLVVGGGRQQVKRKLAPAGDSITITDAPVAHRPARTQQASEVPRRGKSPSNNPSTLDTTQRRSLKLSPMREKLSQSNGNLQYESSIIIPSPLSRASQINKSQTKQARVSVNNNFSTNISPARTRKSPTTRVNKTRSTFLPSIAHK